jgi:hypothetical protein
MKLVKIVPSTRKDKKYMAMFDDQGSPKTTHFGAAGYSDYTIHHDEERRERYLKRHSTEDWTDPTSAGTLARFVLWNKPTLAGSIRDYKKRFSL